MNIHRPMITNDIIEEGLYEHFRFHITEGQQPMRIDVFIPGILKNASRTRIKNIAMLGGLRVNDKSVKASYKVKPGDVINIYLPYPPPPDVVAEAIPLDIVYEDNALLLINKPPGMVCHPGVGNHSGTLVNALLYYFNQLPQMPDNDEFFRPGLVHRIDKDTSGLLLIAKTEEAMFYLAKQFKNHTTQRTYYALVWGILKDDKGTITGNIDRSDKNRKLFHVYKDGNRGKHAVTHYEVVERFEVCTLVKCRLETGRTHQIRVHFTHIGHPLFGDIHYGGDEMVVKKSSTLYHKFIKDCLEVMPRQALHAFSLGFLHPDTEQLLYREQKFPLDFETLLQKMRAGWK